MQGKVGILRANDNAVLYIPLTASICREFLHRGRMNKSLPPSTL